MTFLDILRIIFGSIFILFIPGFILTYIFFEKADKEIDWLERITFSLALSIAVVPLTIFLFNLIGVDITALNVFLEILLIIVLSLTWIFFTKSTYYTKFKKNK